MDEKIIIFVRIILNIFGNDYRKRKAFVVDNIMSFLSAIDK